jgi:hypothetical protein
LNEAVFISGSISIKSIPECVKQSIQLIKQQNLQILVGDADGIDFLVQKFCKSISYSNVMVYSIYDKPRFAIPEFKSCTVGFDGNIKRERERQSFKDAQMTKDSMYSFVIWDGKSQGSYKNILRAIELEKKIKVYLSEIDGMLPKVRVTKDEVEYIFRKNVGYSASEIVELLHQEGIEFFKDTRAFNKKMLEVNHIKKDGKVYLPGDASEDHFIVKTHRGKVTGIQFTLEFVNWIEEWIKRNREPVKLDLFS